MDEYRIIRIAKYYKVKFQTMKTVLIKQAMILLSDEQFRKTVSWVLVAVLSPVILLIALLCSIASGGAAHNNATVYASFYGSGYSAEVPAEFRTQITEMQAAFSLLDSAVAGVNSQAEAGNGLDPIRVKAIFYVLCFGEDTPSRRAADRFIDCFYTTEERVLIVEVEQEDGTVIEEEQVYFVTIPLSIETAFANLTALLGREITAEDRENMEAVYQMVVANEENILTEGGM